MASTGHRDVDLPSATLHRAGSFLADFQEWLTALGYTTWTVDKEPGNHLTNFWLYATIQNTSPAKSRVQFGATQFAKVNPRIHAYARAKGDYLTTAVGLLQKFIDQVWTFEEQAMAPEEITTMHRALQHEDWDQFEVLDMQKYRCPTTERLWFSTDDSRSWFIPDADSIRSVCGNWLACQDDAAGVWWCNADARELFFLAAA